ncbi:MFS transporter [Candidatus Woesebacteria bacterium]|nr:MFS transporter [Candidatus Woesebacteria bacterium]MBP9687127.1 MFS transporter [Candidatus Woesebacteria bacterium]
MKSEIKILLLCSYINVFAYALFSPLYAVFVQRLDSNLLVISSTWGVYALFQGIVMILFGKIEDHFKDKRPMIVAGYLLLSVGALSFAFISTVTQLYLVQAINALANGILLPAWKSVYSKAQDKGKEAQEWSLFDGGNLILASIAAFVGGYIVTVVGFTWLFFIIFVFQLVTGLFSLSLLNKHQRSKKRLNR